MLGNIPFILGIFPQNAAVVRADGARRRVVVKFSDKKNPARGGADAEDGDAMRVRWGGDIAPVWLLAVQEECTAQVRSRQLLMHLLARANTSMQSIKRYPL